MKPPNRKRSRHQRERRGRAQDRCKTGKVRYRDYEEAKEAITSVRFGLTKGLPATGRVPIRAYRCEFCNGFHLTSREERSA